MASSERKAIGGRFMRAGLTLLALATLSCGNERATDPEPGDPVAPTPEGAGDLLLATGQSIVTGSSHACALLEGGAVKCWGYNGDGELGLEDTNNRGDASGEVANSLPFVRLGRPAKALAAGAFHTCAILDNNQVKCWGSNSRGQLGIPGASVGAHANDMGDYLPFVSLGTGRTAKAIAAGNAHTCAILDNNQVKCWGINREGTLGIGDTVDRGALVGDMGDALPIVYLGAGRTALAISAGDEFNCAILDNNQVKCWGLGDSGQRGSENSASAGYAPGQMQALPVVNLGTGLTAKAIASSDFSTCVILNTNAVKCWGGNLNGEDGLGNAGTHGETVGSMGDNLLAVDMGTGLTPAALAGGGSHFCARFTNNSLKCWGFGFAGELGLNDTVTRGDGPGEMGDFLAAVFVGTGRTVTAVAAGGTFTCAVLDTHQSKCWGGNNTGQLGAGDTLARGDDPNEMQSLGSVPLGTRSIKQVVGGGYHTCALLNSGQVKCWGWNFYGQLGVGDTNNRGDDPGEMGGSLGFVDLGSGLTVASLIAGHRHTCALFTTGQVKCWGGNNEGELGLGDTNNRGDNAGEMGAALPFLDFGSGVTVTALAAGGYHTCATLSNGTLKCWGFNPYGELGLGDFNARGDNPNEMGTNLPAVSLGTGLTVASVAAGYYFTCARFTNGQVKCWGYNGDGELGLGDVNNRGDNANEMGANLPAVSLGTGLTASAIASGGFHSCALLNNGTMKCWGFNGYGQLGLGDTNNRGDNANEMGANLPTVSLGQGQTISAISVGGFSTCALLGTGSVKCWGLNAEGLSGTGDTTERGDGVGEMGDELPTVSLGDRIAKTVMVNGSGAVCSLLDTNQLKCWGRNVEGQLGLGDTNDRGDNPHEMGDALPVVDVGPDAQDVQ